MRQTSPSAESTSESSARIGATPPRTVRVAIGALLTALAAGIVEMIAQLWPLDHLGDSLAAIAIRLLIYAAVLVAIAVFARGRNWARFVLLFGIGVLGMFSLLIDPMMWILEDPDFGAFLAAMDAQLAVITGSRIAHIAAVIIAVVAMLLPTTRRHCANTVERPQRFPIGPQHKQ